MSFTLLILHGRITFFEIDKDYIYEEGEDIGVTKKNAKS
jgi:hypothetical protein